MTELQTISWIFLSTAIASQNESADFNSISNIADGINHAIPTHKELQSSLAWLIKHELVVKEANKYSLTENGKSVYMESCKNEKAVFKILEKVYALLNTEIE